MSEIKVLVNSHRGSLHAHRIGDVSRMIARIDE